MAKRGHHVQVVCVEHVDQGPRLGVAAEETIYEGIRVHRLSFRMANSPDPQRWEYENLWIGDYLREFLARENPDVFHLISGYLLSGSSLQAAHELKIPSVITLTDFWFLCPRITLLRSNGELSSPPINPAQCARCLGEEKRRYRIPGKVAPGLMDLFWRNQDEKARHLGARQSFLQSALQQADLLISPSQFLRSVYIEAGVDPEKIIFLRHGVDSPAIDRSIPPEKPTGELRIGYLGQIVWHKGVHILEEAVRQVPDKRLKLRIYGNASAFPKYAETIRRYAAADPRIELAGAYQGEQEQAQILRELDAIVVPSLWYENCPLVVLEAFSNRIPVIASDLGGLSELVTHGENGLLFPAGSAQGLALQLRRLLDDPDLLPRLRRGVEPGQSVREEMDRLEQTLHQVRLSQPKVTLRIAP
jgi:glycosyltransferase involved in cell wall biosynthesis